MIRGYFNLGSGWLVPWVRALLFVLDLSPKVAAVEFIVDTGCSGTVLHPLDTTRHFGVDVADLQRPDFRPVTRPSFGVGGSATNFVLPAWKGFVDESGQVETIAGQIYIAQWSPANQGLPSLLGWDVLQHFELSTNLQAGQVSLRRLTS